MLMAVYTVWALSYARIFHSGPPRVALPQTSSPRLLQEELTAPTSTASADWLVGSKPVKGFTLSMRCAIFTATWILKNRT
jgi:hypothetical protein